MKIERLDFSVFYTQGTAEAAIKGLRDRKSEVICDQMIDGMLTATVIGWKLRSSGVSLRLDIVSASPSTLGSRRSWRRSWMHATQPRSARIPANIRDGG